MNEETEKHGGGRGRPKKDPNNLNNIQCKTWLGPEERDMLNEMSTTTGLSKSEMLRRIIRSYNVLYKQERDKLNEE